MLLEISGSVPATSDDSTASSELPVVGMVVKLTGMPRPLLFQRATATFQNDSSASFGATHSRICRGFCDDALSDPEHPARIAKAAISGATPNLIAALPVPSAAAPSGLRLSIQHPNRN